MTVIALVLSPCENKINFRFLPIIAFGPYMHCNESNCTGMQVMCNGPFYNGRKTEEEQKRIFYTTAILKKQGLLLYV
jgi:hypothetical protein